MGVKQFVVPGSTVDDSRGALELAQQKPNVSAASSGKMTTGSVRHKTTCSYVRLAMPACWCLHLYRSARKLSSFCSFDRYSMRTFVVLVAAKCYYVSLQEIRRACSVVACVHPAASVICAVAMHMQYRVNKRIYRATLNHCNPGMCSLLVERFAKGCVPHCWCSPVSRGGMRLA